MPTLHETTFDYLTPTNDQKATMGLVRGAFKNLADFLEEAIPAGPDKTFLLRQLRDCGMWANIAITRNPDGSPRT
jgi:hypothetical protein